MTERYSTELDAVLERPHEVGVGQLDDVKVVGFLHVLDPPVGLVLRVDHQRPTTRVTVRTTSAVITVNYQQHKHTQCKSTKNKKTIL